MIAHLCCVLVQEVGVDTQSWTSPPAYSPSSHCQRGLEGQEVVASYTSACTAMMLVVASSLPSYISTIQWWLSNNRFHVVLLV